MKIELHINDTTWGLFVDGLKISNGLVEHGNEPRTFAIHARTGTTEFYQDGKVSNPEHARDGRKPRWLTGDKLKDWIIHTETPAERAALLADMIASEAYSQVHDQAIAEEQERRRRQVAGGGGLAS